MAKRLGDAPDMLAMDLPGHGRSPDWDRAVDFHDQATAMARAVLPEGAHVVGHSFGATVALRLALEGAPVRSLTLVEPVLFAAARAAGDPSYEAHRTEFRGIDAAFRAGDREGRGADVFRRMGRRDGVGGATRPSCAPTRWSAST